MRISDWSSDVCSSDLPLLFIPELLHEGSGAGTGDGAEVVDKLLAVHADAVVGDGEGLGRSVGLEADAEGAVVAEQSRLGKRGVAQPVTGVGGVGARLPQEDILIRVERVRSDAERTSGVEGKRVA